jgi:hypothetical protein
MKFENEFVVRRPLEACASVLASDATITSLFPDTEIVSNTAGVRETRTRVSALGTESIVRFKFKARPGGGMRFEKICDGKIWRALEGDISLAAVNDATTRVVIAMEGSTRALVPEFTIKGPMKDQLQQMTRALRARMDQA